jgi:hypothetical protein
MRFFTPKAYDPAGHRLRIGDPVTFYGDMMIVADIEDEHTVILTDFRQADFRADVGAVIRGERKERVIGLPKWLERLLIDALILLVLVLIGVGLYHVFGANP